MKVSQSLRHLHTLAVQISKILATIQINAKETIEIRIKEEVGIIIIILKELLKKRAKMQREEHKEGMEVTEVVEIKIRSHNQHQTYRQLRHRQVQLIWAGTIIHQMKMDSTLKDH